MTATFLDKRHYALTCRSCLLPKVVQPALIIYFNAAVRERLF